MYSPDEVKATWKTDQDLNTFMLHQGRRDIDGVFSSFTELYHIA